MRAPVDAWQADDMFAADANPIDGYLTTLGRRLRGPARLRADLLTEARHGLEDAAASYEDDGLDSVAARRRAVAEFGDPGELAPAYQAELTAAHGRRLAVLLTMLPVAMLTSDTMWWRAPTDTERPSMAFLLVTEVADWAAYATGALALGCLVLLGRHRSNPHRIVRPLAVIGVAAAGFVYLLGTVAAAGAVLDSPAALAWPPMLLALVCLNGGMGALIFSGVRCLRTARGPVPA